MPIEHSPKSTTLNASITQSGSTTENAQGVFPIFSANQKKRKMTDENSLAMDESTSEIPSERSIAELFLAMNDINDNINQSREKQIASINELRHDVNGKFGEMDRKISSIDVKVDQAGNDITLLKAKINEIEQEKLATRMEINGIDKAEIDANKLDPTSHAIKVMNRFNIQVSRNEIQHSYYREWKQRNVSILVVNFVSVDIKADVMKKKRAAKETNNVYFDHAMTPATRALFVQAKKKAKEINARFAFISHGNVFISIDANKKIKIDSAEVLDSIKATVVTSTNSTSTAASSTKPNQ